LSRENANKTIPPAEDNPDDRELALLAFRLGLYWMVLNEAPPAHV
jgi:hypothetical protein